MNKKEGGRDFGTCYESRKPGSQQGNNMARLCICILHDKDSERSRFREIVRSFKDCGNMPSRKNGTRVENNGLIHEQRAKN